MRWPADATDRRQHPAREDAMVESAFAAAMTSAYVLGSMRPFL